MSKVPTGLGNYTESVKLNGGSYEVVRDYVENADGVVTIPSRANLSNNQSALQINGFNPHIKQKEIVYSGSEMRETKMAETKDASDLFPAKPIKPKQVPKKGFTDPAVIANKANNPPKVDGVVAEPTVVVYFHVPGMRVPYNLHEIIVDLEKALLVFVLDSRSKVSSPEFERTNEGEHLVFSFGDPLSIYHCSYHGQSFVSAGHLINHVFVIENCQPYHL